MNNTYFHAFLRADGGMEGKFQLAMLADRSGKICKKFGVFDAEEGVARKALVVIDPSGTARHMVATSLTMDRLIDDTLKALATFQGKVQVFVRYLKCT